MLDAVRRAMFVSIRYRGRTALLSQYIVRLSKIGREDERFSLDEVLLSRVTRMCEQRIYLSCCKKKRQRDEMR